MFGWFRRDPTGYTQAEREIFRFWDGGRKRKGDPLAIHRALLTDAEFDAKLDPGISAVPTIAGLKATGRVAGAVRRAFKIPELEQGGLTDGECLQLFCEFGAYIRALTEDGRPLASSPGPTASATDESTTATGADSGSTASVAAT